MRWEILDLLDWEMTRDLLLGPGRNSTAAAPSRLLILDKSTADAISCGPDVWTPLLGHKASPIHPAEVLALHLGAVAEEGSIWLALSYSNSRFDFLSPTTKHEPETTTKAGEALRARHLWTIDHTESIPAQTSPDVFHENVHIPQVYHTLFTLRRTARNVSL